VAFVDNRWRDHTRSDMEEYLAGLRDWVEKGDRSAFVLEPAELRRRLRLPTDDDVLAAANFRMGEYLHARGLAEAAVPYFKTAQRLGPENWCYKRQAWQLTDAERYYGTSFQAEVEKLAGRPYYVPPNLPR